MLRADCDELTAHSYPSVEGLFTHGPLLGTVALPSSLDFSHCAKAWRCWAKRQPTTKQRRLGSTAARTAAGELKVGRGAEIGQLQDLRHLNLWSESLVRLALALKISSPAPASPRSRHIHFKRAAKQPHSSPSVPWQSGIQELRPLPVTSRLGERHKDGDCICIAGMISACL